MTRYVKAQRLTVANVAGESLMMWHGYNIALFGVVDAVSDQGIKAGTGEQIGEQIAWLLIKNKLNHKLMMFFGIPPRHKKPMKSTGYAS